MQYIESGCQTAEFSGMKEVGGIHFVGGGVRASIGMSALSMSFVNEEAAGAQALYYFGKNISVEEKKDDREIEPSLRSLVVSEIIYYKVDVGCDGCGVLPSLFDRDFGNINERDFPALFCQPDGVPPSASGKVEGVSALRENRQNVLRKSP